MSVILPCPVCGRSPKIKHYSNVSEHIVRIVCKLLFKELHESALAYGMIESIAYEDAINLWNARVRRYQEANKIVS